MYQTETRGRLTLWNLAAILDMFGVRLLSEVSGTIGAFLNTAPFLCLIHYILLLLHCYCETDCIGSCMRSTMKPKLA